MVVLEESIVEESRSEEFYYVGRSYGKVVSYVGISV